MVPKAALAAALKAVKLIAGWAMAAEPIQAFKRQVSAKAYRSTPMSSTFSKTAADATVLDCVYHSAKMWCMIVFALMLTSEMTGTCGQAVQE